MPQAHRQIAAVIFDMDGVLLDTEPLYRDAMIQACADLGYELSHELHLAQVGMPSDAGDRLMRDHFGPQFPMDKYNTYTRQIMNALTKAEVPVKPGVRELLIELKVQGIPAAVATSTRKPTAPERLERAGLIDFFQTVVTRDDVTHGKPHPEPFARAAEGLGIAPEICMALEDSHNGIRSAHAAGTLPVMVPDLLQPSPEITALCHAVLPNLHEVRRTFFASA